MDGNAKEGKESEQKTEENLTRMGMRQKTGGEGGRRMGGVSIRIVQEIGNKGRKGIK